MDAYDVNPFSLQGIDDNVSRGPSSVIVTNALTSVRGACPKSWRPATHAEDFCRLSGNPPHLGPVTGDSKRPGLRLLVTGSIHYTVK